MPAEHNQISIVGFVYHSPSDIIANLDKNLFKIFIYNNSESIKEFEKKIQNIDKKIVVIVKSIEDLKNIQNIANVWCFIFFNPCFVLEKIDVKIADAVKKSIGWKKIPLSVKKLNTIITKTETTSFVTNEHIKETRNVGKGITFERLCDNVVKNLIKTKNDKFIDYFLENIGNYAIGNLGDKKRKKVLKTFLGNGIGTIELVELVKYIKEVSKLNKLYKEYQKVKKISDKMLKHYENSQIQDFIFVLKLLNLEIS